MRMVTHENMYNGLPLSESRKNNQGSYVEILQKIEFLFEDMISRHANIFFVRFDLRYPAGSALRDPDDNVLVSQFVEVFSLYCKRHRYDPRYLWVRELSETGQPHYHFMLLLNGDRIQNAHKLIRCYAAELWRRCLGIEDGRGFVELCPTREVVDYGGIKIRRNHPHFQEVFERCYQWASYLAKRYSKKGLPPNVKGFDHSRRNRDKSI